MGKGKKKIIGGLFAALLLCVILSVTAYAGTDITMSAASAIRSRFQTFIDIAVTIVQSIGTIWLLWQCFQLGLALQSNNSMEMSGALKGIAGGLIAILAPEIAAALGASGVSAA